MHRAHSLRWKVVTAAGIIIMVSIGGAGRAEGPPPGYKPVWSEEFNYHGLPDPAKWGYEEGFVRNHESQYYTKARQANARAENGMLVIEGRKEHFKIPHPDQHGEDAKYTSASLVGTPEQMTFYYDQTCYHRFDVKKADQKDGNPLCPGVPESVGGQVNSRQASSSIGSCWTNRSSDS